MKKILFPFETGSSNNKEAFVYAAKFARNLNAELILLNTFQIRNKQDISKEEYNRLIKNSMIRAYNESVHFNNYYLENYAKTEGDLRIKLDHRFIQGILTTEIIKIIEHEEIDLTVLAASDKAELNSDLLKIIDNRIFENNLCSLLVVPFDYMYKRVENIVYAIGLDKLKNYKLYLNDVLRYAAVFNANIHFIHISPGSKPVTLKDSDEYNTIMQIVEKNKNYLFKIIYGDNLLDSMNKYIGQKNINVLILVKHRYHFLDSLFRKSFSDQISLHSKIPVIIMREKDF